MASTLPEAQLDSDIATIRAEIASLRTQKALLSTTLLSSLKTQKRLQRAVPTPQIESALAITATQTNTNTANLYNSLAGITAFRVQDPDPNAVDNGKVLGIRIDVFSSRKKMFETPYYLLLNQPEGEGGRALGQRYIPYPDKNEEGDENRPQDLPRFVRAVRRECVSLHKRIEAVQTLQEELGRALGVMEVRALDGEGREVEIEFVDKHVARISVDTDGTIGKVVVRNGSQGGASVRGKAIERLVLGGDGRIDSLLTRLSDGLVR
ncbi:hypothetical protein FKW77_009085 [Venturia effusa]|uniref:Cenp-O kinetochore centromere component n=1 Tax=Venturia effusa TaxID=50376 RepID=A0A517KX64_9PEZI|nr:hypothetical protein FKW77_009085 [Venturia effusa]